MVGQFLLRRSVQIALVVGLLLVLLIGLVLLEVIPIGLCWGCLFWQDSFWLSFFPSCLAELIGGVFIAAVVAWAIQKLGAPKPQAKLMLEQRVLSNGMRRLSFRIATTGRIAFRAEEIHWDLYIAEPQLAGIHIYDHITTAAGGERLQSKNVDYSHYYGLVQVPLFHGMSLPLFYSDISPGVAVGAKIYYVLSTPYGQIPENLKRTIYGSINVTSAAIVEPHNILGSANITFDPMTSEGTIEVRTPDAEIDGGS